jgi:hypothetical protein
MTPLDGVGFHPNGVVSYDDPKSGRFLLQCADTRGQLRIYEHRRRAMRFIGSVPAPKPLRAVPLDYVGREGLVGVFSVAVPKLTLYNGLDGAKASFDAQRTVWRQEDSDLGEIRSPIQVRLDPEGDRELLFIDTLVGALRALRFDADGEPFFADVYALPSGFEPTLVVAQESASDFPVLFVLGGLNSSLRILWAEADGGFAFRDIPLPADFNDDVVLIADQGQPPLLVISRQSQLVLLRFPNGLQGRPVWALIDTDPSIGQLILEAGDFDNDGHTDLVVANTGNRKIPPLVVYGPVWESAAALSAYYTDAGRFDRVLTPDALMLPSLPGSSGRSAVPRLPAFPIPRD